MARSGVIEEVEKTTVKSLFRYVSNNNRLEILSKLLEHGYLQYSKLQELTKIKPSPLTFHLKILVAGELVNKGKMNGLDVYFLTNWGTSVLNYVDLIATKIQNDEEAPEVARNWAIAIYSKLKLAGRQKKIEKQKVAAAFES